MYIHSMFGKYSIYSRFYTYFKICNYHIKATPLTSLNISCLCILKIIHVYGNNEQTLIIFVTYVYV